MVEAEFDFDEFGTLLVEATEPKRSGMTPAGRGAKERVKASLQKVVGKPLTAFSRALAETLPAEVLDNSYEINHFTVEFGLNLSAEVGRDGGVDGFVAKIVPNGTFKCTYTWAKKKEAGPE